MGTKQWVWHQQSWACFPDADIHLRYNKGREEVYWHVLHVDGTTHSIILRWNKKTPKASQCLYHHNVTYPLLFLPPFQSSTRTQRRNSVYTRPSLCLSFMNKALKGQCTQKKLNSVIIYSSLKSWRTGPHWLLQYCLVTHILQYICFCAQQKKLIQVWNNMRVSIWFLSELSL